MDLDETIVKKMEPKLEAWKVFECNLPNEVWCDIFSYLDKKSLKNVTATCKLWFGMIRGNEKFSGRIKMKFTDLKDMAAKITDSEWLKERWPSIKVLEVSLGNQFLVGRQNILFPKMTKVIKLIKFDMGFKRRKPLISHYGKVTMNIQDVIKKFKFGKFAIRLNVVRVYGDNWGLFLRKYWRNSKRRRQSISTRRKSSILAYKMYKASNSENPKALWCYSMLINMYPKYQNKRTEVMVDFHNESCYYWSS